MTGIHDILISTVDKSYHITIDSCINIIRGDSGIGKTDFFELIRVDEIFRETKGKSPVTIICDVPIVTYSGRLEEFEKFVSNNNDSIIVIDEDSDFIRTKEFSEIVFNYSNYYILITRLTIMRKNNELKAALSNLPFSVKNIFTFISEEKDDILTHTAVRYIKRRKIPSKIDIVLTEDAKSGYQWFSYILKENSVKDFGGNGNIYRSLGLLDTSLNYMFIVDGAAFGPFYDKFVLLSEGSNNVIVYAPDSFEYTLIASGIIHVDGWNGMKEHIYDFIDNTKYKTRERFYTELAYKFCTPYKKSRMPIFLLIENNKIRYIDWLPERVKNMLSSLIIK